MKKTALKKLAAQVPQNDAELSALLAATVTAQTSREAAVATRDQKINEAKAAIEKEGGYDATITDQDTIIARNLELIETWAALNKRTLFKKTKSIVRNGHRFGWRLGTWGTELKKKVKWDDVVAFLGDLIDAGSKAQARLDEGEEETPRLAKAILRGNMAAEYRRVKVEADKKSMLRDREDRACRALLKKAGVNFSQEESFYLEPDREGQEGPRMEAA